MKTPFSTILMTLAGFTAGLCAIHAQSLSASHEADGTYTLVVSGFDWGPAANKVILDLGETGSVASVSDYQVTVSRSTKLASIADERSSGNRGVVFAYTSDENGKRVGEGNYITLVLSVGPDDPIASPMEYINQRNHWIDYQLTITNTSSNRVWNKETRRIRPIVDNFDLTGAYQHENGQTLTYAAYIPKTNRVKSPLIIWLHGGGEGGTDPSIALMANLASNYASEDIQTIFGGAYVLAPQTPTFWMQAADGGYTLGQKDDIQNGALMGLIQHYVDTHPGVDGNRIYVGGCSNGGYMSLKLILLHPDFFVAGYISALGYQSKYLSDEQIESIKHVPIWFVHAADDRTLEAEETAVPIYKRLIAAGAPAVHFSFYDHVTDIRGFFGGKDYWYNGHFSWIYCHANTCKFDFDGSPVIVNGRPASIMEWMAAQKK